MIAVDNCLLVSVFRVWWQLFRLLSCCVHGFDWRTWVFFNRLFLADLVGFLALGHLWLVKRLRKNCRGTVFSSEKDNKNKATRRQEKNRRKNNRPVAKEKENKTKKKTKRPFFIPSRRWWATVCLFGPSTPISLFLFSLFFLSPFSAPATTVSFPLSIVFRWEKKSSPVPPFSLNSLLFFCWFYRLMVASENRGVGSFRASRFEIYFFLQTNWLDFVGFFFSGWSISTSVLWYQTGLVASILDCNQFNFFCEFFKMLSMCDVGQRASGSEKFRLQRVASQICASAGDLNCLFVFFWFFFIHLF